jgi:hypothetical protein
MAKTLVSMDELKRLILAEIRKHDGCEDVTDVSIYHVTDDLSDSNWSVGVVACGGAAPDAANRAAINAQVALRRSYELQTD